MNSRKVKRPRLIPATEFLECRALMTVLVAVIDSGVDLSRITPDVAPYYDIADGYDLYSNKLVSQYDSTVVQDNNGPGGAYGYYHGSHVAEQIVNGIRDAKSALGAGSVDVKVLPIRATTQSGSHFNDALIEGVFWAVDHNASVIDLSIVWYGSDPMIVNGFYAHNYSTLSSAIQYASDHGVVVVVSAANDNQNIETVATISRPYPAWTHASNMIVAAAVDGTGNLSPLSNWGGVHVDLGSPTPGNSEGATSYSAGYAAGVAGVIAALRPAQHTAVSVVDPIKNSVTPHTQAKANNGPWSTTNGNINPAGAVALVVGSSAPTALSVSSYSWKWTNLSWSAVTGATSYTVERSTSSTFATFSTLNATSATLTDTTCAANTLYYYRVRAVVSGQTSARPTSPA